LEAITSNDLRFWLTILSIIFSANSRALNLKNKSTSGKTIEGNLVLVVVVVVLVAAAAKFEATGVLDEETGRGVELAVDN